MILSLKTFYESVQIIYIFPTTKISQDPKEQLRSLSIQKCLVFCTSLQPPKESCLG